jgi:hypothetical protein
LYTLTAWNVRAEAFAIVVVMVMASIAALWLPRLIFGRWSLFDVWIPVIMLSTIGYEVYLATTNLAHPSLPVLLIFTFTCATFIERPWVRVATLCLISSAAVFTGFGIFLGVLTPMIFFVQFRQHEERSYAIVGIVWTIAALFLFTQGYYFQPAVSCFRFPAGKPSEYFLFFALMAARPLSILPHPIMVTAGSVIVLFIFALAVGAYVQFARVPRRADSRAIFILAGFSLLFGVNAAVGRLCLGVQAGQVTRYVPYMFPGLLAIYIAFRSLSERIALGHVLAGLFVLVCLIAGFSKDPRLQPAVDLYRNGKSSWAACYRLRHNIETCDLQTGFKIHPDPAATHLKQKLDWLEIRHLNFFYPQQ